MDMGNAMGTRKGDRMRFEVIPEFRGLDQLLAALLAVAALGFGWRLSRGGHPFWGLALLVLSWVRLVPTWRYRRIP